MNDEERRRRIAQANLAEATRLKHYNKSIEGFRKSASRPPVPLWVLFFACGQIFFDCAVVLRIVP